MRTANILTISRVANGFMVEMPRPMPERYFREPVDPSIDIAEGIKAAMPVIREMVRLQQADPLLESLTHPEEPAPAAKPEPEEIPADPIGVDAYVHVFATWDGVIGFLENLFF